MLSPDLRRKIRYIELRARRNVQDLLAGAYHSIYKGRGMSFSGVRPYMPGDDIRSIDWKVTARVGIPHIKQFVEERELTVMLIVDGSPSVLFGTQTRTKQEFVTELAAVLAYAAVLNQDRVGLIIFGERVEYHLAPGKSRNHILRLLRDLLTYTPRGSTSNLASALTIANRTMRPGGVIFILSDFLVPIEHYSKEFKLLSKRHDTTCVVVQDPLEQTFPDIGIIALEDMESRQIQWIDTSINNWQDHFAERRAEITTARENLFKQAGAEQLVIAPGEEYMSTLIQFFLKRGHGRT